MEIVNALNGVNCGGAIVLVVMFSMISICGAAIDSLDSDKEFTIKHNSIGGSYHSHFMTKYASMFELPPTAEIFLTKGDTEDTVPLYPDNNGDITITDEMLHNGTQYNHVVIACNSSYPVEWVYENGDGVK